MEFIYLTAMSLPVSFSLSFFPLWVSTTPSFGDESSRTSIIRYYESGKSQHTDFWPQKQIHHVEPYLQISLYILIRSGACDPNRVNWSSFL